MKFYLILKEMETNIMTENIVQDESLNNHEQSFTEEAIKKS